MTEDLASQEQDAPTALDLALHEVKGLHLALKTRTVIGQAVGIVMAQRTLTSAEAFAHLVELSSHSNLKLRDVAAALVSDAESRAAGR